MKPFIGIKNIWYGMYPDGGVPSGTPSMPSFTDDKSRNSVTMCGLTLKRVTNSHEGTWGYSQDDPSTTDYKNELTGKIYYRDMTDQGAKNITFSMGVYEFSDRTALQGAGDNPTNGWASPREFSTKYGCILAETKTGNFICFPYAGIVAKVDTQEKNLCLGVTATAMEPTEDVGGTTLSDEYWFAASSSSSSSSGTKA